MRKNVIVFIFLVFFTRSISSQFDAQQSQYMFHHSSFNPAAVGESGLIDVVGQYRANWLGMPGAGSTTTFSVSVPVKTSKTNHAFGLSLLDDEFGWFSNKTFHLQYALKKNLWDGVFSIGVDLGFVSVGFSGDSVSEYTVTIGDYHQPDDNIPLTGVQGMDVDVDVGLWYSQNKWYVGGSYIHMNQPVVSWDEINEFSVFGLFYCTGGYNYSLRDSRYVLSPSALFKTDFTSWQVDLTTKLEFNDKYWVGMTYRTFDALVFLGGINVFGGLSVGYSFDLALNKAIYSQYGSHEFLLSYSFEYMFTKNSTKYKSIRFL